MAETSYQMFHRSAIWRGLNLLQLTKITVITFLEKNSKMKLSGEYIFRIREKTLSQMTQSKSFSLSNRKVSNAFGASTRRDFNCTLGWMIT